MKLKTKRLLFAFLLLVATVWNLLCFAGLLALAWYQLSVWAVGGAGLALAFWQLFFPGAPSTPSKYIRGLSPGEKRLAAVSALLGILWFCSALACLLR